MNIFFDIDETLVRSSEFDASCFVSAVHDVHGFVNIHTDWDTYTHVTDQGLIEQIAIENDLTDARVDDVMARYISRVDEHLASTSQDCLAVPGVQAMLQALQPDHRVALATGGWREVQKIKLANAEIAAHLPMFGSDGTAARVAILQTCHAATADPGMDTVYVGDGEWDMRACHELGWNFIGIGPRLEGKCERWIADFVGPYFSNHLTALIHR